MGGGIGDEAGVLAGVGFEEETRDVAVFALVDEGFDEGESAILGVEGETRVAFQYLLVYPRPGFVYVREIGDDQI